MKTVWKYGLSIVDFFHLILPIGAEILSLQTQNGYANIWALVDTEVDTEVRDFRFFGTGHPIDEENINYIGTVIVRYYVWHLFEIK